MATASSYTVTSLSDADLSSEDVLQRLIAFRLHALQSAPASYHSNYAHESHFTDAQWSKRLTSPTRHDLICKYTKQDVGRSNGEQNPEIGDEGEWIGMLTMLGPLSKDDYVAPGRVGPALGEDDTETRWHLVGLYLELEHRGREAGIAVHEAVLDFVRDWTEDHLAYTVDKQTGLEKARIARLGGTLGSQDPTLKALYEALGAYEVGRIGKAEALQIAGNQELIAEYEATSDKNIVVMEGTIEC